MDVAIYARLLSDRQDVDLSISPQLRALIQFAEAQGHHVVRQFVDEVESGRSIHRAEFQEMISLARGKPPPFQAILVWKLSRFARNREDSILYKSFLKKQGVKVISINEPLDDSPTGRMMEGIIEVLDEFYSANLAQDVVRGMREAASRGFWVSAGTPYGYHRVQVQDGGKSRVKLEPDEANSDVVRSIFRLALAGEEVKEISKWLNHQGIPSPRGKRWGKSQVHGMLANPVYMGCLVWGTRGQFHKEARLTPVRVEEAFPEIIDKGAFQRVQDLLHSHSPRVVAPRWVNSRYLLSGLLRCGGCGAAMFGVGAKSGRFHY